jgi:hypothetical protein
MAYNPDDNDYLPNDPRRPIPAGDDFMELFGAGGREFEPVVDDDDDTAAPPDLDEVRSAFGDDSGEPLDDESESLSGGASDKSRPANSRQRTRGDQRPRGEQRGRGDQRSRNDQRGGERGGERGSHRGHSSGKESERPSVGQPKRGEERSAIWRPAASGEQRPRQDRSREQQGRGSQGSERPAQSNRPDPSRGNTGRVNTGRGNSSQGGQQSAGRPERTQPTTAASGRTSPNAAQPSGSTAESKPTEKKQMSHWERLAAMLGLKSGESKEATPEPTKAEPRGAEPTAGEPLADLFIPTQPPEERIPRTVDDVEEIEIIDADLGGDDLVEVEEGYVEFAVEELDPEARESGSFGREDAEDDRDPDSRGRRRRRGRRGRGRGDEPRQASDERSASAESEFVESGDDTPALDRRGSRQDQRFEDRPPRSTKRPNRDSTRELVAEDENDEPLEQSPPRGSQAARRPPGSRDGAGRGTDDRSDRGRGGGGQRGEASRDRDDSRGGRKPRGEKPEYRENRGSGAQRPSRKPAPVNDDGDDFVDFGDDSREDSARDKNIATWNETIGTIVDGNMKSRKPGRGGGGGGGGGGQRNRPRDGERSPAQRGDSQRGGENRGGETRSSESRQQDTRGSQEGRGGQRSEQRETRGEGRPEGRGRNRGGRDRGGSDRGVDRGGRGRGDNRR